MKELSEEEILEKLGELRTKELTLMKKYSSETQLVQDRISKIKEFLNIDFDKLKIELESLEEKGKELSLNLNIEKQTMTDDSKHYLNLLNEKRLEIHGQSIVSHSIDIKIKPFDLSGVEKQEYTFVVIDIDYKKRLLKADKVEEVKDSVTVVVSEVMYNPSIRTVYTEKVLNQVTTVLLENNFDDLSIKYVVNNTKEKLFELLVKKWGSYAKMK